MSWAIPAMCGALDKSGGWISSAALSPWTIGRFWTLAAGWVCTYELFGVISPHVHGVDIDPEKVAEASQELPNIRVAPAEDLPYPDGMFDVVLSHEVIEHVDDDRQALAEAVRVLRDPDPDGDQTGGRLVVFAPNRLYPFETHGAYWRGRVSLWEHSDGELSAKSVAGALLPPCTGLHKRRFA